MKGSTESLSQIMSPTMHMKISRNFLCQGSVKACSKCGVFPVFILRHMRIESETCMSLCVIYHVVCNSVLFLFFSFCPLQPSLLPSRCPSACSPCQAQLLLQTTWSVYKLCSEPCCSYMSPATLQTLLHYTDHISSKESIIV